MRVKVLFFGMLKDIAGSHEAELELPPGADVGAVFDHFAARFPRFGDLARSIVPARNREFATRTTPVENGDEIAFLPPVSGGAGGPFLEIEKDGHYFALTRSPIEADRVAARILTGAEGAVVTFEGTVRNNTQGKRTRYLDYEGYEPMALRLMAEIGLDLARSFAVGRVAMIHRLGRILIGEASVAVIVTAPHRRPAFEAALEGINRLKKQVPIWKKEYFADGEVWVEGEWDDAAPRAAR